MRSVRILADAVLQDPGQAFLTEKKDTLIKRNPVVDFLAKVERESPSTKSKTLQITFSGDDLKSATIGFSQFKPK